MFLTCYNIVCCELLRWVLKMKNLPIKLFFSIFLFLVIFNFKPVFATTEIDKANSCLYRSSVAMTQEEKDYYISKAKEIYTNEYNKNILNLDAMIGLGKIYTLLGQRTDAKNILMQAYSTYSNDPKIQAALGDFSYSFQEYNNALEFYKLALASGYLKDYNTNLSSALCYEKLGDNQNAKLYYKIALFLNNSSNIAKERLSQLESPNNMSDKEANTIFINNTDDEDISKLLKDLNINN